MNHKRWSITLLLAVLMAATVALVNARANPSSLLTAEQMAVSIELVTSDVNGAIGLANAGDGSDRLFIIEQPGRIKIWDGTQVLGTPFLDVSGLVTSGGERGLLGLAFHPDYATNGLFYINYTDNSSADTVVAEYQANPPSSNTADPTSARILIEIDQPFSNHNGGHLAFGPDGYLYIGMGDGGSAGDPNNYAQNLQSLLGKMLRIDPNNANTSDGLPYDIPADNPFVGDATARDEIWAYGLRNPWRFSFDRATGALIIGDVGQNEFEEIDLQLPSSPGGENYGWRLMEGFECFNPQVGCNDGSLTLPVFQYPHVDGNCSVTGGYRYQGAAFPQARGYYLFADYCSGRIWAANYVDGQGSVIEWMNTPYTITSFGEDEAGELYFTNTGFFNSAVYTFVQN